MVQLRKWQQAALAEWATAGNRGIVEVVTGGGKTIFALACAREIHASTTLVVVPTQALLDQWWEEAASFFDLALDEVNIIGSRGRIVTGTINIGVINSAAKLDPGLSKPVFLVVDECHKAASAKFRAVLDLQKFASLGLSATPERQYDDGLQQILVPALGDVIYRYDYRAALADGVIVPFDLRNIVFELEEDRQLEYDKLTRSIARTVEKLGPESPEAVALMLKRSRVLNLSTNRVILACRLALRHARQQVLVFHEDVEACQIIHRLLTSMNVESAIYHSALPLRQRAEELQRFRRREAKVLVTCRALDEGFNVPETEVGIIAASTATRRQRIQRLGRVLRPSAMKSGATVYSLVATDPEIRRLKEEEANLEGVANVEWSRA